MVRTMVIAVAVVTFVAGIQVSDGRVLTSELQSNAVQGSTATELQEGASGVPLSDGSIRTSEPESNPTQESTTTEQQKRTSGVEDSDRGAQTSGPQSSTSQQFTTGREEPEGTAGVPYSDGGTQTSEPQSTASEESTTGGGQQEETSVATQAPDYPDINKKDCNFSDANHLYSSCDYACGDEMFFLTDGQRCQLNQGPENRTDLPGVRQRDDNLYEGFCKNGTCVAQTFNQTSDKPEIEGTQVPDVSVPSFEPQSNETQGSTTTEKQEETSGVTASSESVQNFSEHPSTATRASGSSEEPSDRSSGVPASSESVRNSSEPPSTATGAPGSSEEPSEGSSGVTASSESVPNSSEQPSTATRASGSPREPTEGTSGVTASSESVPNSSEPPSTATRASGSSEKSSEGSSGTVPTTTQFEETNPDCNVTEESHVYRSCQFFCEGDEAFFLGQLQPCYLPIQASMLKGPALALSHIGSESPQGLCHDGECLPKPVPKLQTV